MPVHNALPYLDAAIESILGQTFGEFEFIILDDASSDGSLERVREWAGKDKRIRHLHSSKKLGPAASSQRVASEASAAIVARMDADDIAHPDRLRRQLEILRKDPNVGLVASLYELIDGRGRTIRGPDLWRLVRKSSMVPFPHDSIMYRKAIFVRSGGYRSDSQLWEDQDLITRMSAVSRIMVIPEPLLQVRQTATSTRSVAVREEQERAINAMYSRLAGRGTGSGEGKLDPRVFLSLGSVELWSGGHPRLFRKLLAKGKLSLNRKSVAAIVWTALASLSPSTLRLLVRGFGAARNLAARTRLNSAAPVEWAPAGATPSKEPHEIATRKARSGKASA